MNRRHRDFQSRALPTELPGHRGAGRLRGSEILAGRRSRVKGPVSGGVGSATRSSLVSQFASQSYAARNPAEEGRFAVRPPLQESRPPRDRGARSHREGAVAPIGPRLPPHAHGERRDDGGLSQQDATLRGPRVRPVPHDPLALPGRPRESRHGPHGLPDDLRVLGLARRRFPPVPEGDRMAIPGGGMTIRGAAEAMGGDGQAARGERMAIRGGGLAMPGRRLAIRGDPMAIGEGP